LQILFIETELVISKSCIDRLKSSFKAFNFVIGIFFILNNSLKTVLS